MGVNNQSAFRLSNAQSSTEWRISLLFSLGLIHPIFAMAAGIMCVIAGGVKIRVDIRSVQFIILVFGLFFYYIFGRDYHMPERSDIFRSIRLFLYCAVGMLPLVLTSQAVALFRINIVCIAAVPWVVFLIIYTYLFAPDVLEMRMFFDPISGVELYSPGLANSAALAAGFISLHHRDSLVGRIYPIIALLLSVILQNRTGIVLSMFFVGVSLVLPSARESNVNLLAWVVRSAILVLIAVVGIYLLSNVSAVLDYVDRTTARFDELGMGSNGRADMQEYAIDALLGFKFPLGGLAVPYISLWFHNLLLDAYRVAGYLGLFAFMLFLLMSAVGSIISRSVSAIIVFFVALAISMSSVVLEGYFMEYLVCFGIFMAPAVYVRGGIK